MNNNHKLFLSLISIILLLINVTTTEFENLAHAEENPLKFGIRQIPTKLIEKTESKIEIFPMKNGKVFPIKIQDLTVTSQNNNILKITGKEYTDGFATIINIKTEEQGETKISLAAPGFESSEFPITVYHNNRNEKKIAINALPDRFSINGPNRGYFSVELLDEDGVPIVAREDVTVSLTTSNTDTIDLTNKEIIIKKGNYYAIEEFSVNKFDESVVIYASAPNVETVQTTISVVTPTKPYKINLFVNPNKASRSSITNAFAIVQLQDVNGNPIRATEDIPVSINIENPFGSSMILNDRGRIPQISPSDNLVIKKGHYWDATKLITNAGIAGEYTVSISAKGYGVGPSKILEIVESELVENRNVILDPVPVLAIGGEELAGIVHLEDDDGNLLLVNEDFEFRIFSSDDEALSIKKVQIDKGQISAAVYASLGYTKPDSLTIHEAYENKELTKPEIFGPRKSALRLVVQPLVPKVMSNFNLPIVAYVTTSDGSNWYFPSNTDIFFSPSEILDTAPQLAKAGSGSLIMDAFAMKEGSETLLVKSGTLSAEMNIENHMTAPTKMDLDIPQRVFAGVKNKMIAQIMDDKGNPIFANSDIQVKIVSNDKSIIDIPEEFMIKRGESFTTIDIIPAKKGSLELAVLSTGFPLIKKSLNVDELKPDVKFDAPSIVEPDTSFVSSILVTMDGNPLPNMDVSWDVDGANVQERQGKTDNTGKSSIILFSGNSTIKLNANISGDVFTTTTSKKIVNINSTLAKVEKIEENENFEIFGVDLFLLTVPLAILTSGIIVKKKGMMRFKNT